MSVGSAPFQIRLIKSTLKISLNSGLLWEIKILINRASQPQGWNHIQFTDSYIKH